MKEYTLTEKHKRSRKFWTFLPVLVVPFLTVIFWLMGGGTSGEKVQGQRKGLNTQLPSSQFKRDSVKDKLAFYLAADADSVKRQEQMRNDPYSQQLVIKESSLQQRIPVSQADAEEQKIYSRIASIQKQVNRSSHVSVTKSEDRSNLFSAPKPEPTQAQSDPEIAALNGTLEKILDIQHPERVKARSEERKTAVFIVSKEPGNADNSFFGASDTTNKREMFYNETAHTKDVNANAIPAVIHATQVVQTGSIIKFRLLTNIYVAGLQIPSGSFVFGVASLNNEQLIIHISSIGYENNALPVSLSVYSMDGLPGIYAPGSITRDVAKQSTDQGLQSIGILNMDPSLKAQAAAAGIGAAKNLLSKKVKRVSVMVKAGYKVLLKDDNQQNANNE